MQVPPPGVRKVVLATNIAGTGFYCWANPLHWLAVAVHQKDGGATACRQESLPSEVESSSLAMHHAEAVHLGHDSGVF